MDTHTHDDERRPRTCTEMRATIPGMRWDEREHCQFRPEIEMAAISIPGCNALFVYRSPNGHEEMLWDTRPYDERNTVPMWITGPEGERMLLHQVSRFGVMDFQIRVGERVIITLTEARAHQMARAMFERISADSARLAKLQEDFESRDHFITSTAEYMLHERVGDVATVTHGMLEELQREDLSRFPAKSFFTETSDCDDDGVHFADFVGTLARSLWPDFDPERPVAVEVGFLTDEGEPTTADAWFAGQTDTRATLLGFTEMHATSAPVTLQLWTTLFNVELTRVDTGDKKEIGAVHLRRYLTRHPEGETPWEVRGASARGLGRRIHEATCERLDEQRQRFEREAKGLHTAACNRAKGKGQA